MKVDIFFDDVTDTKSEKWQTMVFSSSPPLNLSTNVRLFRSLLFSHPFDRVVNIEPNVASLLKYFCLSTSKYNVW